MWSMYLGTCSSLHQLLEHVHVRQVPEHVLGHMFEHVVGHMLEHVLTHVLEHVLRHVLEHVLRPCLSTCQSTCLPGTSLCTCLGMCLSMCPITGFLNPPLKCAHSLTCLPRSALTRSGLMFGSQETVSSSYLSIAACTTRETISSTLRPGRGLREPSMERAKVGLASSTQPAP